MTHLESSISKRALRTHPQLVVCQRRNHSSCQSRTDPEGQRYRHYSSVSHHSPLNHKISSAAYTFRSVSLRYKSHSCQQPKSCPGDQLPRYLRSRRLACPAAASSGLLAQLPNQWYAAAFFYIHKAQGIRLWLVVRAFAERAFNIKVRFGHRPGFKLGGHGF